MIKASVVFDLDGTLVDSAVGINHIANLVLERENRKPLTLEQTVSFIGNGISTFIERMSAARDLALSDHSRLLAAYIEQDNQSDLVNNTYPDVKQTLQSLIDDGCSLGLCTNKLTTATNAMLQKMDMAQYFNTVVCGDTLAVRKPNPQMLIKALNELDDAPTIYVGDSEVDAETAQRARVPFILFTEGYRKTPIENVPHTRAFSSYRELPTAIKTLLPN